MNKRLLCLILTVILLLPVFVAYAAPADVDDFTVFRMSSWAKEEVSLAQAYGLLPERAMFSDYTVPIARIYFCDLIVKCYRKLVGSRNVPTPETLSFLDTESTNVEIAYQLGIISGMGNGNFAPYELVTREQVAKMISIMVRLISNREVPGDGDSYAAFSDGGDVSEWARVYVSHMVNSGYMKGVSDNQFAPLDNLSTESAVILVKRIFTKFMPENEQPAYITITSSVPDHVTPGRLRVEWKDTLLEAEEEYYVTIFDNELYYSSTAGIRSRKEVVLSVTTTENFAELYIPEDIFIPDAILFVSRGSVYSQPIAFSMSD